MVETKSPLTSSVSSSIVALKTSDILIRGLELRIKSTRCRLARTRQKGHGRRSVPSLAQSCRDRESSLSTYDGLRTEGVRISGNLPVSFEKNIVILCVWGNSEELEKSGAI
jgi:hypothetical protein